MRVGAGIILSVLSSSVLAAVIPDYDSHGILLVRRTVNPDNIAVLWKRAGEEQTGPGPSSSGAGASTEASTSNGQSNPDDSGINSELKKLDHFLKYIGSFYKSHYKSGRSLMQRMAHRRDKQIIKIVIKKLTTVIKGEQAKQSILIIKKLLTTGLESVRTTFELFSNKAKSPLFSVSIPKGRTQKTVTKEMLRIQGLAKKEVEGHIKDITSGIAIITKLPQHLKSNLNGISTTIANIYFDLQSLYDTEYKKFISTVNPKNNEENIKVIEQYLSEANKYRKAFDLVFDYISEDLIENGKIKLIKNTPTSATRVKQRLGMKVELPPDETLDPKASNGRIKDIAAKMSS
ncbi:hypothetical protein BASA50_011097 [Batrachochytrium salamandrivorans]|uniref:Uncharacterized protein n=1 Tax=Batrachochytrium salamandrivorans TaxID=1357716 RepID=A0ABQ8EWI6_9FUNG|nr:hypothetical protein BASA50_011097 [Batrachochytrium salamandrivorans]